MEGRRQYPDPFQTYIGYTTNLKQRLVTHSSGKSIHTANFKPWQLVTYLAFSDKKKALKFKKYVKIRSGHAFAKKHL